MKEDRSVSPDGTWRFDLNTYSSTLVLQEASALQRKIAKFEHDGDLLDAVFSPNGRWLATSSQDGTVRLWPLQAEDIANQACKLLPRNLTAEEWSVLKMEGPYRKTCPNLP